MKTGTPRADGLAVAQLTWDAPNGKKLTAKFHLVDTRTGRSVAAGEKTHWSSTVADALTKFLDVVEAELAEEVFDGAPPTSTGTAENTEEGIGEFLGDANPDAPDV